MALNGLGLQDLGKWGTNLLDKAQEKLAPQLAEASGLASTSLQGAKDLVKSSTKTLKKSFTENIGGFVPGPQHVFNDPRDGERRTVQEVAFLAEGAFGSVVKVSDVRTSQNFAMKKICCQEGVQVASSLEAAETEAKILQSLPPHPHIIACYGSIIDRHPGGANTVKLLLELCSGGHLLDFMDSKDGNLSAREILEPFAQVTDAVKFLHSRKPAIQHRDLKVENVLKGNDGKWKLCDFGSCSVEKTSFATELPRAKLMKLQEEIDKTVTMLYRPPEMADIELNFRKGFAIDEQVDVWMLGCILYTLAFYRHPFQDNATAMAICNAKYFIPFEHPMARSSKLCALVHWSLAANPKDRPTSAHLLEVLKGIGKIQYEELFSSMPVSVREKIQGFDKLYSKRRDTGDIQLPSDLGAAVAAAQAVAAGGSPAARGGGEARRQQPAKASKAASDFGAHGPSDGGFDIAFALDPAAAAPAADAPRKMSSGPPDLMAMLGETTNAAHAPVAPPTPAGQSALGDLLDLGAPAPPTDLPHRAASAPAVVAHTLGGSTGPAWDADFASFASAPAQAAGFSPGSSSFGGCSPMPGSQGAGSPLASSPLSGSPGVSPGISPRVQAPAGAPAFVADFADFSAAPAAAAPQPAFNADFGANFASFPPPMATPAPAPFACGGAARAGAPAAFATPSPAPASAAGGEVNLLDL